MKTIIDAKEEIERYKELVLKYTNKKREGLFFFEKIILITVEEDIALWKVSNFFKGEGYLYTNLNGELLFNGKIFSYATAFSNSRACVKDSDQWYILDLEKEECIFFPQKLYWENINGFRNDQLVVFDSQKKAWGSYAYHPEDHTFTRKIPFIWDALEISREKDYAYVGLAEDFLFSLYPERNNYYKRNFLDIPVIPLPVEDTYDIIKYYQTMELNRNCFYQREIQHIYKEFSSQCIPERVKQVMENTISSSHALADVYFQEQGVSSFNSNNGYLIDAKSIKDYQKKIGRLF